MVGIFIVVGTVVGIVVGIVVGTAVGIADGGGVAAPLAEGGMVGRGGMVVVAATPVAPVLVVVAVAPAVAVAVTPAVAVAVVGGVVAVGAAVVVAPSGGGASSDEEREQPIADSERLTAAITSARTERCFAMRASVRDEARGCLVSDGTTGRRAEEASSAAQRGSLTRLR